MNADTVNCAAGAAQRPVEKKRSKIPVKWRCPFSAWPIWTSIG